MAKIIPISEHFQHFLAEMKESFWGDLYGQTKLAWQRFFELQSERQRDRYSGWGRYERRRGRRRVYRNGYYERDFVTRFGTIRLRSEEHTSELQSRQYLVDLHSFPTRRSSDLGDEREFLGRFVRADEASLAAVFRAAVGAATRSLFGLGAVRTAAWPTASLSQRLLRAGFCDPLRHHPAEIGRAHV